MEQKQIVINSNNEKIVLSAYIGKKELPAVIFLPGTMANPYTYISFINEFKKYEMSFIGINYIFHGRSKRYSKKEAFTIQDMYANVMDTIKYVKENIPCSKIVLFGHSQGGILATMLINNTEDVDIFILGDTIISTQKELYSILKLPKIFMHFAFLVKLYFKIQGLLFPLKQLKFSDYVNISEEERKKEKEDIEKNSKDQLRVNTYPMSMVSSLINVDTTCAIKKESNKKIYLVCVKDDEIFPLNSQIEAFNLIASKNKELIIIDSNEHMIYTEEPEKMAKKIYELIVKEKDSKMNNIKNNENEKNKEKDKKIELLAPAGSFLKAITAFRYGADAIYTGTPNLSLRSRAKVDDNDLEKIIKYAKKHNKKVYAAINIFAKNDQYDEVKKQAKFLNDIGIDGIILADGGILDVVKEYAPNIPINISTQANTLSLASCNFWQRNGAKRIILSREISKEEIEYIMKNKDKDLEIETFIHGAMCFAYSGRCFLSEFMADRSANSGDCAQCCRWGYNMYIEEKNNPGKLMSVYEDQNGSTIMSSKDLCLLDEIPFFVDLKVDSLKIEGRLKTEYYLATIVNIYRTAIDEYIKLKNENRQSEFNPNKYFKEIDKIKTRELTKFNFAKLENRNQMHQDLSGHIYNQYYIYCAMSIDNEFSKKAIKKLKKEKEAMKYCMIDVKNKINLGEELEIILPGKLEPVAFKVSEIYEIEESNGEIILLKKDSTSPGREKSIAIINVPIDLNEGYVIRKKK